MAKKIKPLSGKKTLPIAGIIAIAVIALLFTLYTTNTLPANTTNQGTGAFTIHLADADYTDRTCNADGSAGPDGIDCGITANKNEGTSDATFDSCTDGSSNSYMHIEDIFVNATTVLTTDTVQVTCDVCCFSSDTEYGILYNNGSGWVNLEYGNCTSGSGTSVCTGIESKTINVPVDDVVGTHHFRCWESYSGCNSSDMCCSTSYADNDDMSIEVIEGGETCAGTDTSCGIFPTCNNCNDSDGCIGASYRNYYCSGTNCNFTTDSCTDCNQQDGCFGSINRNYYCAGTSCTYTSDLCTDCSCTCDGYGTTESTANGNCSDGKDNDCDGDTDGADSGCSGDEESGELVSWGCEVSPVEDYGVIYNTPTGTNFKDVSAGEDYSLALREDGSLAAWGWEYNPPEDYGVVYQTPTGTGFKAADAGGHHAIAVRNDGSLVAWGWELQGWNQISDTPTGTGFKDVSAGVEFTVALREDGSLVSWGKNWSGEVSETPSGNDFKAISAGDGFAVAIKNDGSLVTWGTNGLVDNTPSGNDFKAVSAAHDDVFPGFAVALRNDGSLVAWHHGYDNWGIVGNLPAGTGFKAVAAGGRHATAVRADGSLVTWGSTSSVMNNPTGTGFIAVTAGTCHGTAIRQA